MKTYPMFFLLENRPCLVVGGGTVGERKVRELLRAGARVTVVSRELTPGLAELACQGRLTFLQGEFSPAHLEGMTLVIGATDDQEVNREVSRAARERGLPVNIVDAPELCTFIVPALLRRGPLTIAVSTGGASPAVARQIREELEQHFGPEYGPYLCLLREIRERLLRTRRGHPDNPRLFESLVQSPLRQGLAQGNWQQVTALLRQLLGGVLSEAEIGEVIAAVSRERKGEPGSPEPGCNN